MGYVYQINVSQGGVPKRAIPRAQLRVTGVEGDRQRTPKVHGGPERAVCLFSWEVLQALQAEGHRIEPGASGENLTLGGLEWWRLAPGDRLRIGGTARLEVTSYTAPCEQNAQWFKDGDFRRISQRRHPGWSRLYAKVLNEGLVEKGDEVVIEPKPE